VIADVRKNNKNSKADDRSKTGSEKHIDSYTGIFDACAPVFQIGTKDVNTMNDKKRVDRVEIGPMDRAKAVDVYSKEFVCTAAGKIQGDLDSEIAEVRGACKVGGNVRASLLKVSGSMKVMGNVRAELIRAKGAFKVEGTVDADNFRIAGAVKVQGAINSSDEIHVQGVLKCFSDVTTTRFNLFGVTDIDGTLRAKEFTAELGGRSAIRNIESETVRVTVGRSSEKPELVAKRISGKDIYLEATVAELVEGENIKLGPGCTIAEVRSTYLEVHKGSKVGKRA